MNNTYTALGISVLLLITINTLLGCSTGQPRKLRDCEASLRATDKRLFRDELLRRCLCQAMQEGLDSQRAIKRCDAECPMALALIADDRHLSVELVRCICAGIKAGVPQGQNYDRCRSLHPVEDQK